MAEEKKIATGYIGNALRSSAADHTTTFTDEIFDTERQKYQNEVNTDLEATDNEIKADLAAETTRAEAAEKANADNIAKNAQAITDETARATAAEQAIIFDVSSHNNGTVFESLPALLGNSNLDTLIPVSFRHGGMTIRYVQTSDNKYVQARCMAQSFTTDVTQWQGVDEQPTAGSDNLVKSGGVANKISELKADVGEVLYNDVHAFTTDAENIGFDVKPGDILAVKVESSAFANNVFGLRYFNGSTYPWLVKLTEQKFYKVEIPSDIVGNVLLAKSVTDNGFDANIKALTGLLANAESTNENLNATDKEVEKVKDVLSLNVLNDNTETFVANIPKNAFIRNVQKGSRIALTISGGASNIFNVKYYNGETYSTIKSISDDKEYFIDVPMDVADGQLLINCNPITTVDVHIYAVTVGYYKDLKDINTAMDNINKHINILSNREYQKYDTIAYGVNGDGWYGNGDGPQKSYIIPCTDNIPFSITANNMDYAPFKFVKEYPVIGSTLADIMVAYDKWNAGAGTTINGIIPNGTKYMVVTIYQNGNTTPIELSIDGIDALRGIGEKINAKNDLTKVLTDASFYEGMKVVKVKKDGSGDFTDIQTAINSIRDASVYNQYDVQIYDDWDVTNMADLIAVEYTTVHAENNDVPRPSCLFVTKDYVHVRGMNGMRTIYLHSLDTDLTERSFQNIQPIFLKGSCILANFNVKVKGGRYAIHQDMSGRGVESPDYKAITIIKDVVAEHLGNSTYTHGSGWQSTQAQANGISDGQTCIFENVKWISHEGSCAFYFHTNANFTISTKSIFKNCQEILLSSTKLEDRYTRISDIGSGVKHFVYMYGCNMPVFTNFKRDATDKGAWLLGYGNRPMLTNETGSGVSMVLENIEDCEEIGSANTSVSVGNALVHDYSINSSGWRLANAGEKAEGVCGEVADGHIKVILSNKCLFRLSSLGVSQQSIGTYIKSNGNGSWATTANKSEATFVCITTKVCKFVN